MLTTASLKTPSKGPCPEDPVLGQLWDGSGRKVIFVIPSCTHTHMQENCSMESAVTNVFEGKDIPRLFNVKSAGFHYLLYITRLLGFHQNLQFFTCFALCAEFAVHT